MDGVPSPFGPNTKLA